MRRELSASDALRRFDVFECDTVDIQVTVRYCMICGRSGMSAKLNSSASRLKPDSEKEQLLFDPTW